mgnify:FL=1
MCIRDRANGLESRSTAEVLSDIGALSTSSVSSSYLTQSCASSTYAPLSGASFTGNVSISSGNAIAVGQSSFSGGGVLADFHASGSGVGSQLAFANDHNTDKFYVGLAGNTTGNGFLYQQKDADIEFYTNNALRMILNNDGNLGIGGDPLPSATNYNTAALHVRQVGSSNVGSQIKFTTGASGHNAADGGFIAYWHDNNFYINNQEGGQFRLYSGGTEVINVKSSGSATASRDFRAPIFYDSNNTSYYVDGASNSNFYQVRAQNGGIIAGTLSQPTSMGQIAIYSGANPYMSWHNGATNARHGYIQHLSDSDRFYFGDVSYTESAGSFRAPLFYDTNNTAYYCDPSSNSNVYRITAVDRVTSANYMQAPILYDYNNLSLIHI